MKKVYYTWQQVEGACLDIARQMHSHYWRPDYIVGITRGGLVPANLLSQYTGIKMNSLDISLRDGGDCVSNLGMAEDAFNGKNILIVDDINDSGSTLNWVMEDWEKSVSLPIDETWDHTWNKSVKFAVLVDNENSAFGLVDYVGMSINKFDDPSWIIFPWENWWKN